MTAKSTPGPPASVRGFRTSVANTIAEHEPVTMIVNVGQAQGARAWMNRAVEIVEQPIDDSWIRDSGPTFLTDDRGRLGAAGSAGGAPVPSWP
ncbi:agmatine deiminase family protein [Streptomyces sp. ISL-100]|uniref:agmatine deiminase family protein n=1 Tax=Streptomyces sp. ISL-100 TaxID=2819173 RepID=UPI0027E57D8E|nr:agmatine deiminase family protein [Streptomyces sp. ISL-100]